MGERMSSITNTAEILVVGDASGVEEGFRPAIQAAERVGQAIAGVGAEASTSARNVEGAQGRMAAAVQRSASQIESAERNLINSAQRMAAATEAGSRSGSAFVESMARLRGVDPSGALAPFLAQLRAVEQAQERVAQAARDEAEAQALAARMQSSRDSFVESLQQQAEAIGRTRAELLELRAAQLGVSTQAAPFIARLREAEGGLNRTGASAAQVANAMRQVPAQLSDVAVQLAGGQSPLMVLMQQGSQLRDSFGSIPAALRGVGSSLLALVNPMSVAAVVLGGIAYAYNKGSAEASAFSRAIINSGNAAGTSRGQLADYAREIGKTAGTQGEAAAALAALTEAGRVGSENLKQFAASAVGAQNVLGRKIEDTVSEFSELGKSPLATLDKLNDRYHFLTSAVYAQVKALEDQGRTSEAANIAQQAYADGIDKQRQKVLDSLTDWERGWLRIKGATSGAIDAVLNIGRGPTNQQKIDSLLNVRDTLEANQARAKETRDMRAADAYQKLLDQNKDEINALRSKEDATKAVSKAEADAADATAARNTWLLDSDKYLDRATQAERDLAKARNEGAKAFADQDPVTREKLINDRLIEIRKQYSDVFNTTVESNIAALQRRGAVEELLAQRALARIQTQRAIGNISEEQAINQSANAELAILDQHIAAKRAELALVQKKIYATPAQKDKDVKDKEGELAELRVQRGSREEKQQNDLIELQDRRRQSTEDLYKTGIVGATAELNSLTAQTEAQFQANQAIGLSTRQVAELESARLYSTAALKDETAAGLAALPGGQALAQVYRDQAQQMRDLADARVRGAVKQEIYEKPLQDLNAMVDILGALDEAAQSAAQGMASAFGSVGQAIGGMTTALTGYERTQAAIAAQLANATRDAHGDPAKIQRANQMAAEASAQAQIKSYGDMASAAKGFFDQNSKGYAVLSGVEKAYRAAEMVMALESMAKKIFFKETEVAATTALNATKLTGEAATTAASTGLAATEASAWGVTAVVKALASLPFPMNLAAGAATLAAVVAVGAKMFGGVGGGSVSLSQQRQQDQGAGSVLGDSDAKSESIRNALDAVEKNTYQDLAVSSSMLATLRSIDNNIRSFASQLVRSTDITDPDVGNLNSNNGFGKSVASWAAGGVVIGSLLAKIPALGNIFGKVGTSIFGGKQSVEDSGFKMDAASLAAILGNGAHAFQFADIKTSGGWFRSDKTSEQTTPLSEAANQQFTSIIKSLADSVKSAGDLLGISGDDFTNKLNSFVVDIGEVSLKGLKGDDLQKAVESVFAKLGDQMAQFAVDGLGPFQQVGEGYLETLTRIAAEYQTIDVVFQSFGKTFGEVGLSSIEARDRLVQLAGGLDKFTSQGEYFLQNFFTEQEQAAALKGRINPTLAKYGLSTDGDDASKMFRNLVVGLDTTKEAGAAAYAELMSIAPAFKAVVDSNQDALDERKELQDQLDELTMSSTQLLAKQRDALHESNRALFDQVQALKAVKDSASTLLGGVDDAFSALQKVAAREKTAVQASVTAQTAAVAKLQTLSQSLRSTLDSLKSPDQKAAERVTAQAQIRAALAIAKAGGVLPTADSLKSALSAVAQDASNQFSSYADYLRDLYQTQNDLSQLADITDNSLSVEQQSLDALQAQLTRLDDMVAQGQEQIDVLKGQSIATLTLAQAMSGLQTAITGAQANPIVGATSSIANMYQQLLGRPADQAGLEYWQNAIAGGSTLDSIREAFMKSAEYKGLHPFAVGTNSVPEDMPAFIHKGERVIPAADNRALMARLANPSGNNEALATEIRALRETVAKQQAALDRIASNTKEHKDMFEQSTGGGGPMLVEVT
jgi:phage-related minor tail protein